LGKMSEYKAPDAIGPPAAVLHPGRAFKVSAKNWSLSMPKNVEPPEKSPMRSLAVGTATESEGMPRRTRRPSYDVKKNVWFFFIGPPNVPPNWFCLKSPLSDSK